MATLSLNSKIRTTVVFVLQTVNRFLIYGFSCYVTTCGWKLPQWIMRYERYLCRSDLRNQLCLIWLAIKELNGLNKPFNGRKRIGTFEHKIFYIIQRYVYKANTKKGLFTILFLQRNSFKKLHKPFSSRSKHASTDLILDTFTKQ